MHFALLSRGVEGASTLPPPAPGGGRPHYVNLRAMLNDGDGYFLAGKEVFLKEASLQRSEHSPASPEESAGHGPQDPRR